MTTSQLPDEVDRKIVMAVDLLALGFVEKNHYAKVEQWHNVFGPCLGSHTKS